MSWELNHTRLRHRMLFEVPFGDEDTRIALACVNQKRAIWRPVRLNLDIEERMPAGESRAVSDLWGTGLLDTPDWQGDMYEYRILRITAAGGARLAAWDARHGSVGAVSS